MRDYTRIQAWQLGDDLTVAVYGLTRTYPKDELYGLISQLRRASSSVPTNIAEGSARGLKKEYLHFLYVARGSLTETQYLLRLSHRLAYLDDTQYTEISVQVKSTFACLHGLIAAVERESSPLARALAVVSSMLCLSIA